MEFYILMLARLTHQTGLPESGHLTEITHMLAILPPGPSLPADCPARQSLIATLARCGKTVDHLYKSPLAGHLPGVGLIVWCMPNLQDSAFAQLSLLRKAAMLLLDEEPTRLDIVATGETAFCNHMAEMACYVAMANGTPLPNLKSKDTQRPLEWINLWGASPGATVSIRAEANLLTRTFTALPPNILTPAAYRERLQELSEDLDWDIDILDVDRLTELGAGAFLAVSAGSPHADAAIVRLTYRPHKARSRIALVGKGICFDTGGHNLKPAKFMAGMHEDMNGSAVVLGILLAATRLQLPIHIDAWLALARNDISPLAYRQGDVITALDGTTIEIVHTDAEGRMVLADTLTLASDEQPDLIIDFATLTGSMITALGTRYAGVFATSAELAQLALEAGASSGERLCLFPLDEDYDEELKSEVADIKQCTLEADADHILAARFLKRFAADTPWLHIDLASSSNKGGLGGLNTAQTGFGVAWGMDFLQRWAKTPIKPDARRKNAGLN